MSEEELAAHHQKLNKAVLKDIQCGLELYGVPAANIRKVMQAFELSLIHIFKLDTKRTGRAEAMIPMFLQHLLRSMEQDFMKVLSSILTVMIIEGCSMYMKSAGRMEAM